MIIYRLTFGRTGHPESTWLEHDFYGCGEAARFTANLVRSLTGAHGVLRDSESFVLWRLTADRPRVSFTTSVYHFTLERIVK